MKVVEVVEVYWRVAPAGPGPPPDEK